MEKIAWPKTVLSHIQNQDVCFWKKEKPSYFNTAETQPTGPMVLFLTGTLQSSMFRALWGSLSAGARLKSDLHKEWLQKLKSYKLKARYKDPNLPSLNYTSIPFPEKLPDQRNSKNCPSKKSVCLALCNENHVHVSVVTTAILSHLRYSLSTPTKVHSGTT